MKTRITLASIFIVMLSLLFTNDVKAQGNLQFNQVILVDLGPSGSQSISVPAGKVWKIESVGIASNGSNNGVYLRNSGAQAIAHFSNVTNAYSTTLPFWLPASYSGSFLNSTSSYRTSVSIIEFNVVP
jgi:hypothetical protein